VRFVLGVIVRGVIVQGAIAREPIKWTWWYDAWHDTVDKSKITYSLSAWCWWWHQWTEIHR